MLKTCLNSWCHQPFDVTADDLAFYEKVSPVFSGKKELIPPPTLCPSCRQQQRLSFRNERRLFRRTCDLTGETIISMYPAGSTFPVYSTGSWWSDKWDAQSYGRNIDFSRPFFDQLAELYQQVPRLQNVGSSDMKKMNSEYVNFAGWNKNCYLIFDSDYNEECSYSNVIKHSRYCIDCSYVSHSELCLECIDCIRSYDLRYSIRCNNCSTSSFLYDCIGCSDCAFCCNLANKKYCLWNTQLTKEEYQKQLVALLEFRDRKTLEDEFKIFTLKFPRKYCSLLQTEQCSGDYITNAQRCSFCFNVGEAQDLRYCDSVYRAKDCMDVSSFGEKIEQVSNSGTIGHDCYGMHFCYDCVTSCSSLLYCLQCHNSKQCFGCVGFRSGECCILNKQYTREEFDALASSLIAHMRRTGEWGMYFPVSLSAFGYNQTVASEYAPLAREEVLNRGWKWCDEPVEKPSVSKIIPGASLPPSIEDIPDDVLNWAIECEETGKLFRITRKELTLYRQLKTSVPHLHPDERHRRRMALRNPRKLWNRSCAQCLKEIVTTYAPERPEKVVCEECYLKEVY